VPKFFSVKQKLIPPITKFRQCRSTALQKSVRHSLPFFGSVPALPKLSLYFVNLLRNFLKKGKPSKPKPNITPTDASGDGVRTLAVAGGNPCVNLLIVASIVVGGAGLKKAKSIEVCPGSKPGSFLSKEKVTGDARVAPVNFLSPVIVTNWNAKVVSVFSCHM
jgi:hypothetical protein